MKTCCKCGETKPLSEFYRMAGMRDGHRNDCKACNLRAKAERHQQNPQPARERAKKWREDHPERYAAIQRQARESGRKAVSDRRSYLRRKYGMTLEQYEAMLQAQGGVCAICLSPPTDGISLHVDHDHLTGEVRGLTCFKCNNALGDLGDDPERLDRAIEYLVGGVDSLNDAAMLIALAKRRAKALRPAA